MLESHRINSPYLLEGKDRNFFDNLKSELGGLEEGPIDRKKLAEVLLKYDIGSLIHGVFLAKKDLAGGRLRIARALSAFIEASGVNVAASGGVKNDHVNPIQVTRRADSETCPLLAMSSSPNGSIATSTSTWLKFGVTDWSRRAETLLILLALYRVRKLLDGDLRLRTACDLEPVDA